MLRGEEERQRGETEEEREGVEGGERVGAKLCDRSRAVRVCVCRTGRVSRGAGPAGEDVSATAPPSLTAL
jgi:hypothetical protein